MRLGTLRKIQRTIWARLRRIQKALDAYADTENAVVNAVLAFRAVIGL
ncbi:MAG: hypothetical protein ACOX8H_13605 [Ruminococcus sp.]|jgi:hypothetical protein